MKYSLYSQVIAMIDPEKSLYPFCIVWTVIPCISWLFPFLGHTGICDSQGIIHDFLGYHINKRRMAFGDPLKYVSLSISDASNYDQCIQKANEQFSTRSHNLCCNNCHHHVAHVLNLLKYQDRSDWSQMSIWWMCLTRSQFVSCSSIFKIYVPFLLVIFLCLFICFMMAKG